MFIIWEYSLKKWLRDNFVEQSHLNLKCTKSHFLFQNSILCPNKKMGCSPKPLLCSQLLYNPACIKLYQIKKSCQFLKWLFSLLLQHDNGNMTLLVISFSLGLLGLIVTVMVGGIVCLFVSVCMFDRWINIQIKGKKSTLGNSWHFW